MEYRTLEINVISANDITDVNLISKMDVYVVVSLVGGHDKQKFKTTVAKDCGTNPTWNFPVKFTVEDSAAKQNRLSVVFKLRSRRALGDKDVGDVTVPLQDFLKGGDSVPTQLQFLSYQVRSPSGKPKGLLNVSYKFGDKVVAPPAHKGGSEPVTAYPAVGPSAAYPPPPTYGTMPYPPPAQGYAYPPPHHGGYGGYPPPPPPQGYGYGAVPPRAAKKNKFGMGLGAGLLGGVLGGMLIGDAISDIGDCDGGYDGGFGDMGGFDF